MYDQWVVGPGAKRGAHCQSGLAPARALLNGCKLPWSQPERRDMIVRQEIGRSETGDAVAAADILLMGDVTLTAPDSQAGPF